MRLCTQFPIGLSLAGVLACGFIDLAFLGHLNSNDLAAASVATLWLSVTSTFLWQGFSSAMSALVSQVSMCPTLRQLTSAASGCWLASAWLCSLPFPQMKHASLCFQALGCKNYRLAGEWLQQTLFHSTIWCIFVGIMWWYTADILHSLGFHHTAARAGLFSRYGPAGS
jgi:Na+-driven multidrug efflux pump